MQHRDISSTPVWPYVTVVLSLFLFSVWATRFWRSPSVPFLPSKPWTAPVDATIANQEPGSRSGAGGQIPRLDFSETPTPQVVAAEASPPELFALSEFQAPRQNAPVAPPVAERVALDVSVAELPPLPDPTRPTASPATLKSPPLMPNGLNVGVAPPPPIEKKTGDRLPDVASCWPYPTALIERLDELERHSLTRSWAETALNSLRQIHQATVLCSPGVCDHFGILTKLSDEAPSLAAAAPTNQLRAAILRTGYAIQRRVEIWVQIYRIVSEGMDLRTVAVTDTETIANQLGVIERRLDQSVQGEGWRRYLMLDELRLAGRSGDAEQRRRMARRVLDGMETPRLSDQQRDLLRKPPFDGLSWALRRWASEPVDYRRLLDDLELYEQIPSTEMAHELARDIQTVRWSTCPEVVQLAETIDAHYRNANLRVAMSEELINRLLTRDYIFEEEVNDNFLGAHVFGQSRAEARLKVVLLPDRGCWRLGLEAQGAVESDTETTKGPATFYNRGLSRYRTRKTLFVDRRGIRTQGADAEADSQINLSRYETDFDYVPILGWVTRSIALRQHDIKYEEARQQTVARLESITSERMDREVEQQVADVEEAFQQKWLSPLRGLNLKPLAVNMETTEQRLIVRYRLAADAQLAAHTPRPQAPSHSLLSVQVHESALNNTLEQLRLDGRREDLRTLYREVAETFQRPDLAVPEDIPENVTIQFADHDAVRLQCDQGHVMITLRITELKRKRRKAWRNFAVRAYYRPDSMQLDANLVREGIVQLAGRLRPFDRIALTGIFSKVLSDDRPFNIINKRLSQDAIFKDLKVTQFVVNDGWIGVALGPAQNAPVVLRITDEDSCVR